MLQWGRLLSKAETCHETSDMPCQIHASMGPPSFEGGNAVEIANLKTRKSSFNGAAFFRRRKRGGDCKPEDKKKQLQWGRLLSKAETRFMIAEAAVYVSLQWGRLLSKAETSFYRQF